MCSVDHGGSDIQLPEKLSGGQDCSYVINKTKQSADGSETPPSKVKSPNLLKRKV